jgi:hypothetical protein
MLDGADVLDVQRLQRGVILMKLAILATVLRPLSHEMPNGLGHAADRALKRFASRIIRAMNLLALT